MQKNKHIAIFILGLVNWIAVLFAIGIWLGLSSLLAISILIVGIVIWVVIALPPLIGKPIKAAPQKQAPKRTIPANADALAAELQAVVDAGTGQFMIFTHQPSERFVQFMGPGAGGPDMIVDVLLGGLSEGQTRQLRDCFGSLDVDPVKTNRADSLMGSFEADATRAAQIGMTLLVEGLGVEAGSALAVEAGEAG